MLFLEGGSVSVLIQHIYGCILLQRIAFYDSVYMNIQIVYLVIKSFLTLPISKINDLPTFPFSLSSTILKFSVDLIINPLSKWSRKTRVLFSSLTLNINLNGDANRCLPAIVNKYLFTIFDCLLSFVYLFFFRIRLINKYFSVKILLPRNH